MKNYMKKILLVEDNETIIMGLKYSLEQEGFQVISAKTAKESKEKLDNKSIDIVLLDVSLPDGNGFEICKEIKEKNDIPVIFLTAQDEETSVVLGLDLGADDYIVKPFRTRELISRIKSVLRRYGKKEENNIIQYKNIKIDTISAKVYKNNKEIIFTSLEYRILLMLFTNQNKLITREQLLEKIWDIAGNFVNDNTLTVYIKRIREKLEDDSIIKTIRGLGYRIGD
jgi:two-component system response regulator VicR